MYTGNAIVFSFDDGIFGIFEDRSYQECLSPGDIGIWDSHSIQPMDFPYDYFKVFTKRYWVMP